MMIVHGQFGSGSVWPKALQQGQTQLLRRSEYLSRSPELT
jgi:hypothetical protein